MDRRRSERVASPIPLIVSSRDPFLAFSGQCNTVDVSYHGCRFVAACPLQHNARLSLRTPSCDRIATARVVRSIPARPGPDVDSWLVGVELDTPGNYWGVDLLSPA
jgi:hypothetical protein